MANLRLIFVSFLVAFGGNFQYGYHISIVNPARETFKLFLNESYELNDETLAVSSNFPYAGLWNIVVNTFQLGLLVGSLPVALLSERFGRKWLMIGNNLLALFGTILVCAWPATHLNELLISGRFLLGLHAGAFDVIQSLYITEISPSDYRGIVASFQEICVVGTVALGAIVGLPDLLGSPANFFHLLWLGGTPSLIQSVLLLWCPESPKHLLLTANDEPAADISIRYFHGVETDLSVAKKLIREEAETDVSGVTQKFRLLVDMPSTVKKAIAVGVCAAVSQVLTGIFALDSFSTLMFKQAGMRERNAQFCTVGITSLHLVLSIVALSVVERLPRRLLLLGSIAGCAVCNCLYVALAQAALCFPQFRFIRYLAISCYLVHMFAFALGAGPLPWFLTAEMVPQRYRAIAQSIAMLAMTAVMLTSGLAFLPLTQHVQSYAILLLFVGPSIVCFVILFRWMPETRGKEVHQLQWRKGATENRAIDYEIPQVP